MSRRVTKGQTLFREGEMANSLFLVKSGTISVRKTKGQEFVEIGRIFQGEIIGEVSFFDGAPRSASAVALSDVEVLEISFESLDKIYQAVPDYLKTIMAAMSERLRKADDLIRKLQNETVTESPAKEDSALSASPTAADVLAATADIDVTAIKSDNDSKD